MLGICAHVELGNVCLAFTQVIFNSLPQLVELVWIKGSIDLAPVNIVPTTGLVNDKSVCRVTGCAMSGFDHQGAVGCERAFAICNGDVDQIVGTGLDYVVVLEFQKVCSGKG